MTNFLSAPGVVYAWRTDIGRVRSRNEDSVAVDAGSGLLVVADGMGGHNAGDVASRMAIEGVIGAMQDSTGEDDQRLVAAVRQANQSIYDAAGEHYERSGMGTTVVAVWLRPSASSSPMSAIHGSIGCGMVSSRRSPATTARSRTSSTAASSRPRRRAPRRGRIS